MVPSERTRPRCLRSTSLTAAGWLAEVTLTDTQLTGQVSDRIRPLACHLDLS